MSANLPEFSAWGVEEVQEQFFLGRLPDQGGLFQFFTTAMSAEPETVVLFQYLGVAVALAELLEIEHYAPAKYDRGPRYAGAIVSIRFRFACFSRSMPNRSGSTGPASRASAVASRSSRRPRPIRAS